MSSADGELHKYDRRVASLRSSRFMWLVVLPMTNSLVISGLFVLWTGRWGEAVLLGCTSLLIQVPGFYIGQGFADERARRKAAARMAGQSPVR